MSIVTRNSDIFWPARVCSVRARLLSNRVVLHADLKLFDGREHPVHGVRVRLEIRTPADQEIASLADLGIAEERQNLLGFLNRVPGRIDLARRGRGGPAVREVRGDEDDRAAHAERRRGQRPE